MSSCWCCCVPVVVLFCRVPDLLSVYMCALRSEKSKSVLSESGWCLTSLRHFTRIYVYNNPHCCIFMRWHLLTLANRIALIAHIHTHQVRPTFTYTLFFCLMCPTNTDFYKLREAMLPSSWIKCHLAAVRILNVFIVYNTEMRTAYAMCMMR